jgi:uncharacterized protein (TIGR00290 family)
MNKPKAVFCRSGGKDSAYCLHKVLSERSYEVCYLLTTINKIYKRISMHGIREELLERQAEAIGIDLLKITVSEGTNSEYEKQMEMILLKARAEGIRHVIYGDIFEKNLEKVQMQGVFPLWKTDTKWLVNDFLAKGFKTIICCINNAHLHEEWVGREINTAFVNQLPVTVDPCGENGEFHTFCYEGPLFKKKILFSTGEKVYKPIEEKTDHEFASALNTKGLWFCDLIPG